MYHTVHTFGNPRRTKELVKKHTKSMIAYMILTEYIWKIPVKDCIVGILLTCAFCVLDVQTLLQSAQLAYSLYFWVSIRKTVTGKVYFFHALVRKCQRYMNLDFSAELITIRTRCSFYEQVKSFEFNIMRMHDLFLFSVYRVDYTEHLSWQM